MSLSPELQALQDAQYSYQGDPKVAEKLRDKVLAMIIAPTKVGKSSVIKEILNSEPYWRLGDTVTTRKHRPDDPDSYVTDVPIDTMRKYIDEKRLVNYTVFDTGHIYGTFPEGFPAEVTLLPTQFRNVEVLQNAGFKRTESIYLVTDPDDWRIALKKAAMESSELKGRLEEGIASLEFAILNANEPWLHFVENSRLTAGLQIAAQKTIAITRQLYDDEHIAKRVAQAEGMLAVAKQEIPKEI
jgi:hypothetical protein